MKYIIGNWKANKNLLEAKDWVDKCISTIKRSQNILNLLSNNSLSIIIAPPYPYIGLMKEYIGDRQGVFIASQDVSVKEGGSYTGEVPAKSLADFINFTILGHSERRINFSETDEQIHEKIVNLKKYNIEPVLCVRDENDVIHNEVRYIAYEPASAISTGPIAKRVSAEDVAAMKKRLNLPPESKYLYGGSVNADNCQEYLKNEEIDGILVGSASLDPYTFCSILEKTQ